MATSFEEIYCLNSVIKNDSRLVGKPDYEIYALNWKYLQLSMPELMYYECLRRKIYDYTPFSLTEYTFTGNGIDNIFELTPAPVLTSTPDFYITKQVTCGESAQQIVSYVWDSENNTITLTNDTPEPGSIISIKVYEIGQFNNDLNLEEKRILATAMVVPYLEEQRDQQKLLNFAVYGGSIKMHSQAEHIKTLDNAIDSQNQLVDRYIGEYSYGHAPLGYPGLGGRTVCLRLPMSNQ